MYYLSQRLDVGHLQQIIYIYNISSTSDEAMAAIAEVKASLVFDMFKHSTHVWNFHSYMG